MRRHIFQHDRAGANSSSFANRHRTEHRSANPNHGIFLDGRMALATLLSGAAKRHPLVHGHVVADRRRLPDDDPHAMVDENP
jgi:hypothetical protein